MKMDRIRSQSGVTIIEVLISSVIFMIGFTTLVALINSTLLKFSTKEVITGAALGQSVILESLANRDTLPLDTVLVQSGIQYRVERQVSHSANLMSISVTVSRSKTKRQIVQLYDALAIPQE
jgi:Tfp pilus assembly protein PilV